MRKIPTIQKVELFNGDNYVSYLVRNVGKRAILVRLKNSGYDYSKEQREKLIVIAAMKAAKRGYKRIVLNYHDDVAKFHNWSSHYCYNFVIWAKQAVRLGYVRTVLEQDVEYTVIPANYRTRKEPYLKSKESDGSECILCAQNIDHGNCDNGF